MSAVTLDVAALERFVPRVTSEWHLDAPARAWQEIDGTLCFVDISGFTALSEKLARRGRIGAEELTEVLDRVFGSMLDLAYARGGSLLKFGGDALLLMFEGEHHVLQGACAAVEMRAALREATRIPTSVGRIPLRMSVGLHTGPIDLYRVGASHNELIITGPTATETTVMEGTADAGEILVSPSMEARLPASAIGKPKGVGRLLRWRKATAPPVGPVERRTVDEDVFVQAVPVELREHLGRGGGEAEHRIATVGFLKFKGVEALAVEGGRDLVAIALGDLITVVQEATESEDVTFLASDIDDDGGKVILTTGVPTTREDDEGRMLRAVRRIADAGTRLPLRIGVNRGHVFAGQIGTAYRSTYTVMGDTVNLAARLMAAAPSGGVYVSPSVLDRSRTLFATQAIEPFRVKGKAEPVHAWSLGPASGSRPPEAGAELPFVGRDEEVALLRSLVTPLDDGSGAAASVIGETGFGKTRLVREALADRADATLTIRAETYGTDNPFWAFRDPMRAALGIPRTAQVEMADRLRSVVADLDESLLPWLPLIGDVLHIEVADTPETTAIDPRFRPHRTADAFAGLLARLRPGPLVLLVEDVHWIDEASAALVTSLAETAEGREPWLVLTTSRPESGHLDPLGVVVALGPLPTERIRDLVIRATAAAPLRPHEVEAIVARAAGNPLFLGEMLRLVRLTGSADELPDSLDAVVGAEIDSLHPLGRRVLRYGSVLGPSFRRVVLDELLAPEEIALDAATRRELARFIEADGATRLRFRHNVMQAVAYQGLSFRKRRELHLRAGRAIERLAGDDPEAVAEFLVLHYGEGGDHERAWRYGVVAGDKARAAFANIEADGHYRRALEAARRAHPKDEQVLDLWRSVAEVREQAGLFDESLKALRAARRLADDDPVATADIHHDAARAHLRTGDYGLALRRTALGVRTLDGIESPQAAASRARLRATRAWVRILQGKPTEAISLAKSIVDGAATHDEPIALAGAFTVLDNGYEMLGRPEEAVHESKALAIYDRLGDLVGVASASNNLGVRAYDEGRWNDAVEAYTRARDAFRQVGNEPQAGVAGANLGEVLVSLGRLDDAAEVLHDARRALRSHDVVDFAVFAEAQLARISIRLGRADDAAARLRDLAEEAFGIGHAGIAVDTSVHLAEALVAAGRPAEALKAIESAEERAEEVAAYYDLQLGRIGATARAALGETTSASSTLDEIALMAEQRGATYERALTLLARAELDGRPAGAGREDAQEADRLLGTLGVVSD